MTAMQTGWKSEKARLESKIIYGAHALEQYFRCLEVSRGSKPLKCAEEIIGKFSLTGNQRAYLEQVAVRADRARGIVKYLENRFGVNQDCEFKDPQGLHRAIFVSHRVPKKLSAISNNIGIGFERERWTYKDKAGFVRDFNFDQLSVPLEKTIERLEKGKLTNCAMLFFSIPSIDTCERKIHNKKWAGARCSIDDIFSRMHPKSPEYANAARMQYKIGRHEMRHVIDNIIGCEWKNEKQDFGFTETQAHLFEECSLTGLGRDLKAEGGAKESLERSQARLASLQRCAAPLSVIECEKGLVTHYTKLLEFLTVLEKGVCDAMKEIFGQKHDYRFYQALSYLFSTVSPEKVPKYLRLVASQAEPLNVPCFIQE